MPEKILKMRNQNNRINWPIKWKTGKIFITNPIIFYSIDTPYRIQMKSKNHLKERLLVSPVNIF